MTIYFLVAIVIIAALALLHKKKRKVPDEPEQPNQMQDPPEPIAVEVATEIPVYWLENGIRKEGTAKMPQGLQVFDANGKCTVDITDRLTKYLGKFRTYASQNEGIVVDERLTADGDLWYMSVQRYGQSFNPEWNHSVLVTKENGQLRWRYPQNTGIRYDFDIIYGVY